MVLFPAVRCREVDRVGRASCGFQFRNGSLSHRFEDSDETLVQRPGPSPHRHGEYSSAGCTFEKEHPNAFWGQLKVRFKQKYNQGISDGAIERAYNRFVERVQKDMTRWGRLLREFSTQSALSDTQRLQELPTHEVVLDILTKTQ